MAKLLSSISINAWLAYAMWRGGVAAEAAAGCGCSG